MSIIAKPPPCGAAGAEENASVLGSGDCSNYSIPSPNARANAAAAKDLIIEASVEAAHIASIAARHFVAATFGPLNTTSALP
jgi:hypothetical protein